MKALLLAGRESKTVIRLRRAFLQAGFDEAQYLNIAKLSILSRGSETVVRSNGVDIANFDAVYLRVKMKLAPFVEPLLDELARARTFSQLKPGSLYLNSNEAMQLVELKNNGIKVAKTVVAMQADQIKDSVEKFHYPLIFKSYSLNEKIQTILIESPRSLKSILKSIRMHIDSVVVREFKEADLIQCAVIGSEVFAVKRRWNGEEVEGLRKGIAVRVSEAEAETAVKAAKACGCSVATVKMSRGFVTEVIPDINFSIFSNKTGQDLYASAAKHFADSIRGVKHHKKTKSALDRFRNYVERLLYEP